MAPLIIEATETSPKVILDPVKSVFEISGESRPENAYNFYAPIISWMENFSNEVMSNQKVINKVKLDLRFEYFNSASSKVILNFLTAVKSLKEKSISVDIHWHYDRYGIDMKEAGEEFMRQLNLPIILIPSAN